MTVENQELIAAGFTSKDIEKIKRHQATGESLDKVLKDLSGHFLSVTWIAGGMAIITLLTAIFGSPAHIISCAAAVIFLLVVLLLVMPVKLGYKSWKLMRSHISDSGHQR
jgi:purine-cytosine permease-like protein